MKYCPTIISIFIAAALALGGCADGKKKEDECATVAHPCETEGETRCKDDGLAIEECRLSSFGCLVWMELDDCPTGKTCDDSGGEPQCVCDNACASEGLTRCSGAVIERCETGADGCLDWADYDNCAEDRLVCNDDSGEAICVQACTSDCDDVEATKCSGTVIQACLLEPDGCTYWRDQRDCADGGFECDDTGGHALCLGECVTDCETKGELRCLATAIQECLGITEDCQQWTDTIDCADSSRVCDDSSGSPRCVTCSDSCDTVDETRCNGDMIQTCTLMSPLCRGWEDTTDCTTEGFVCSDASGTPECVCPTPCGSGDTRCRGNIIQTCELQGNGCYEYEDGTDCAADGHLCSATSGTAECVCPTPCTTGQSRCSGNVIQTCATQPNGCLDFADATDCAVDGHVCQVTGTTAACICPTPCVTGETRCSGNIIQTCATQPNGCLDYADEQDCTVTGLFCSDRTEPAVCTDATGETCASAIVVTSTPFAMAGTDITADFRDDHQLSGTGCINRSGSVEMVFAVVLAAGETVLVREMGNLDAVVSFQETCGDSSACVLSEDYGETTGFRYTATADGRLYVIVEAWSSTPYSTDYDVRIDILDPEDCGDTIDNDVDGDTDCDDSDCFGNPTYCAVETNCADGADNDADTQIDCADSDCVPLPACQPKKGYYELFDTAGPVDIAGYRLTYTPAPADPNLYTWAPTGGMTAYGVTPGSGTATRALALSDDDYEEYIFTLIGQVQLFTVPYTSLFVGSNGYVTFGEGSTSLSTTVDYFFDLPLVAGLRRDLNPSTGGTVTVDEFADRVAVTWDNVPQYGSTTTLNSFQIVIAASGVVDVYYLTLQSTEGITGISSGVGTVNPPETNFIP
jgi:hypothetical protein